MDEQRPIHVDCTWAEYQEIIAGGGYEPDKIYFITDIDNSAQMITDLIEQIQALREELNELREGEI